VHDLARSLRKTVRGVSERYFPDEPLAALHPELNDRIYDAPHECADVLPGDPLPASGLTHPEHELLKGQLAMPQVAGDGAGM